MHSVGRVVRWGMLLFDTLQNGLEEMSHEYRVGRPVWCSFRSKVCVCGVVPTWVGFPFSARTGLHEVVVGRYQSSRGIRYAPGLEVPVLLCFSVTVARCDFLIHM